MSCKLLTHILLYSTVRFATLRDALLEAAAMRRVIYEFNFCTFAKNVVQAVKSKLAYTTVRFATLKDALLEGASMRPII